MFGIGLVQGLYTTAKRFLMKKVTERYPEVLPDLAPRSRGSFGFDADACISCGLCSDACPNGVIKVDYFLGEKNKRQLELYSMNLGYCLFCGLCVEVCPRDAIFFKTDFDLACYRKDDTLFTWRGNGYRPPESRLPGGTVAGVGVSSVSAAGALKPAAAGGGL
ncbi:MAG: 4Fe-4S binding protein [Rectinemataceae bacterium]